MTPLSDNPFTVLTSVVAPAILTNASSVLCLSTGNRLARVVDRTRAITKELVALEPEGSEYEFNIRQLEALERRAQLLLGALRIFYATLGAFAAAALIAVIGSALTLYDWQVGFHVAAAIGLGIGVFAVTALATGCALMVRETRLAVQTLEEESRVARDRHDRKSSRHHTP